jgi:hypothetical protein
MPKAHRAAARSTDVSRELGVWNAFSDTAFDGRGGDGAGGTAARAHRGGLFGAAPASHHVGRPDVDSGNDTGVSAVLHWRTYYAVDCITDWTCVAAGVAQFGSGVGSTFLPLQAMAAIARSGYRFVASDGGIFNNGPSSGGSAPFLGSMGGQHLNAPIVGMATMPAGDGYYEVAAEAG